ncbi:flavodoxin family protein [Streptomyces coeruleorubidus]|uniref:Flavodoxin family protein n=1 Tax=Streptomyces coeruleorubidus TaxID=116188 RepID=A0A5J6IHS6_STRC4|nr:flavodoxin family protein [Streptomyces coeruleorubidus]
MSVDTITDEQWAQLDAADAIIFGSATYMGTASAAFHSFAQASSKRWFPHAWVDKLAAGFTNAGAQSPTDAGPDAVHRSDIATAEHLVARVARQAAIFRAGRATLAA